VPAAGAMPAIIAPPLCTQLDGELEEEAVQGREGAAALAAQQLDATMRLLETLEAYVLRILATD